MVSIKTLFGGLLILLLAVLSVSDVLAGFNPIPDSRDVVDNGAFPNAIAEKLIIDSIAVHKAAHEMLVFRKGILLKKYVVQLGSNPIGPKQFLGDHRTPEGTYYINAKNPASRFHKSLGISYPNAEDLKTAAKQGRSPGGDIMIHGLPNGEENVPASRYRNDWTWGCIAVRNAEIDELFEHTEAGIPIVITP